MFFSKLIREQLDGGVTYPVDQNESKKLATHRVRRVDKDVTVTVPEGVEVEEEAVRTEVRESVKIQALLAEIGSRMGTQIWIPPSDRAAVLAEIYSGVLRMADLLALQPNMDIRLHIVAPTSRREKVSQELLRPVFSSLERGPLSEVCTHVSYDSVRELAEQEHLSYLSEIEEYEEMADT